MDENIICPKINKIYFSIGYWFEFSGFPTDITTTVYSFKKYWDV